MTREKFEREAEKLHQQCADNKEARHNSQKQVKWRKRRELRRMARKVHSVSEADMTSEADRKLMRQLRSDGMTIDEIAKKFETCNLTVVLIVDHLLNGV